MVRPTLLVAEPEPDQALSIRKLVLESGKFNVLTAHSTTEAIELFRQFPKISGAVVAYGEDIDCESITRTIKAADKQIPVIALSPQIGAKCGGADYNLSSHEPQELLETVRALLGDPREIDTAQSR